MDSLRAIEEAFGVEIDFTGTPNNREQITVALNFLEQEVGFISNFIKKYTSELYISLNGQFTYEALDELLDDKAMECIRDNDLKDGLDKVLKEHRRKQREEQQSTEFMRKVY